MTPYELAQLHATSEWRRAEALAVERNREYRKENQEMPDAVDFTVEFASGYETTARIGRECATRSEYWVEITDRQNPYDLSDEPVRVDGVELDSDGRWQADYLDPKLCTELGIEPEELYS